jgi:hypothetical protein
LPLSTSVIVSPQNLESVQGQTPGHKAFVLTPDAASELVRGDLFSKQIIFSYLTGDDLLSESFSRPSRYIIDMEDRDVVEARTFVKAYKHLELNVLPDRKEKAQREALKNKDVLEDDPDADVNLDHEGSLEKWWLHFRGRPERKEAIQGYKRYIACSRVTKRPIFEFVDSHICPSDALQTFAFEDDYSFGILQSNAHWEWFKAKASTLKSDYRYTPNSVFDTFPWPQSPTPAQVKAVADAGRALHEYRRGAMARNPKLTLRELYRSLELPGKNPLKDLHAALDAAVLAAYAFPSSSDDVGTPFMASGGEASASAAGKGDTGREKSRPYTDGDVLAQLLALNQTVAARIERGESVTAPGIPADYPTPAELVSAGCIQPPELI